MATILSLVSTVFRVLEVVIIIDCLLSWIAQDKNNDLMRMIDSIVSPILEPFRQVQYRFLGNISIDLSPILAIFTIQIVERLLYMIF